MKHLLVFGKKQRKLLCDEGQNSLTLPVDSVSEIGHIENQIQQRTHASGWTIEGQTYEDWYEWGKSF